MDDEPGGERLTFTHDDPGPFLPGGGADPDGEERADGSDGVGPDGG